MLLVISFMAIVEEAIIVEEAVIVEEAARGAVSLAELADSLFRISSAIEFLIFFWFVGQ